MSIRIPWDIHETVFLIDMCKKVESKELSRSEAITQTSSALRQKAINAGIEIDEMFRNENGITFQMNIMFALLTGTECKLHSASKMFRESANLSKSNPQEFVRLLDQAKSLVGVPTPTSTKAEKSYCDFKKKRLDLLSIGDMAYTIPVSFKYLFHHTKEVSSWNELYIEIVRCLSKDYPLVFSENKSFSDSCSFDVGDKKASKKMRKAVRVKPGLYIDTGFDAVSKLRRLRNMLTACSLEIDAILIKYVFDENGKAVHDIEELIRKNSADTYTVDWDSFCNYSGTKPLSYRYKKCRYEQVYSWAGLWVSFLTRVYKDYPYKFKSSFTYGNGAKPYIGAKKHAKKMVRPVEFATGIYAETSLSANSFIARISAIMQMAKISSSELKINYIAKADIVFWGGQLQMNDSVWKDFLQWLQDENSPVVAREILSNLSILNALGRKNKKLKTAVSQITNVDEISALISNVTDIKSFGIHSRKIANSICKALNTYKQYLITCEELHGSNDSEVSKERTIFLEWMKAAGIASATIQSYLSAINQCSNALKEYEITSDEILLIKSTDLLVQYRDLLLTRTDFKSINEQQHNRLRSALNKLIDYRSDGNPIKLSTVSSVESLGQQVITLIPVPDFLPMASNISDPETESYEAILRDIFTDGLLPNALRLDKFRMFYEDEYGIEPTQNDDLLIAKLKQAGSYMDGRIYPKQDMKQTNLVAEMLTEIINTLNAGARCVFVSCIMERWRQELSTQLNIYNENTLKALLVSQNIPGLFITDYVLKATAQRVYPEENVVSVMRNSHSGLSYLQLKDLLWYIPMETIKATLLRTPQIVNVDAETYFYAPNFPASPTEMQHLKQCMLQEISQKGYLVAPDIARIIENNCKTIAINTADYKDWAYRNVLKFLFRDDFEFGSSVISEKGKELEMWQVYREYCLNNERITLDDLKTLKDELCVTIYWDTIMSEMVRVNMNELIRRDLVHFDVAATDSVLDEMCSGDYISLEDIRLFLHFPPIEYPWNVFVLESYLQESKAFKLYHASYTNHGAFGVVVRSSSKFADYQSVVVDMLAHSNEWSTTKEALELIVEKGYQARKRWTNFEQVAQEASLLREKIKLERM